MRANSRRSPRRNERASYSICWQDNSSRMRSIDVESLDSSDHGIGISSPVEVPPGTTVFLESKTGSTRGYTTSRRCVFRDFEYIVGLEFDEAASHTNTPASPAADFDYYEFLQISPKAEMGTIQRIYRFMAGRFHPDNPVTGDPEKFLLLKHAYEVLSDPASRAEYDAKRDNREVRPNPIFEMSEFVNGIEGETNRRLGVLSLLYGKRRTCPDDPKVSLYDLEKRMGWPREYLDFTTWYLRSMQYITREDNSDFSLTALGVDYVESNYTKIPMLQKLLNSGTRTTTSATTPDDAKHPDPGELFLMGHGDPIPSDTSGDGGQEQD